MASRKARKPKRSKQARRVRNRPEQASPSDPPIQESTETAQPPPKRKDRRPMAKTEAAGGRDAADIEVPNDRTLDRTSQGTAEGAARGADEANRFTVASLKNLLPKLRLLDAQRHEGKGTAEADFKSASQRGRPGQASEPDDAGGSATDTSAAGGLGTSSPVC